MTLSGTQQMLWLQPRFLTACVTVTRSHCQCHTVTVKLLVSHCHIFTLSHCNTVTLSLLLSMIHCHTFTVILSLEHCQTVKLALSHCHTVTLSLPTSHTVTLSLSLWHSLSRRGFSQLVPLLFGELQRPSSLGYEMTSRRKGRNIRYWVLGTRSSLKMHPLTWLLGHP